MRLSLLLSAILCTALALPVAAQERIRVHLFQYGSTNTPEAETAFLDFQDMMTDKLPRLASELGGEADAGNLGNIARLSLWPVPAPSGGGVARPIDLIPDLAAQRNHWDQTGALALLTGRVKRQQASELAIRSSFFLGDIGRSVGSESIDLELAFSDTTYDTTNDSHSVAVLYALALELLPGCAKTADVYFLLNQASLRAQAVAAEEAALGQTLETLVAGGFQAVETTCPSN